MLIGDQSSWVASLVSCGRSAARLRLCHSEVYRCAARPGTVSVTSSRPATRADARTGRPRYIAHGAILRRRPWPSSVPSFFLSFFGAAFLAGFFAGSSPAARPSWPSSWLQPSLAGFFPRPSSREVELGHDGLVHDVLHGLGAGSRPGVPMCAGRSSATRPQSRLGSSTPLFTNSSGDLLGRSLPCRSGGPTRQARRSLPDMSSACFFTSSLNWSARDALLGEVHVEGHALDPGCWKKSWIKLASARHQHGLGTSPSTRSASAVQANVLPSGAASCRPSGW